MNNKVITIDKNKIAARASEYFMRSSGLSREGQKFEKMRLQAELIRCEVQERVDVRAVVSYYDDVALSGDLLHVGGQEFQCNPFSFMKQEDILGAYAYVITGGDYYLEEREIMDQLLADIWGTSYVDAGRDALTDWLLEDHAILRGSNLSQDAILSPSFGPGYYGMETGDVVKLFDIMDAREIGVVCRESGVMVPLKSCTGIYLVVKPWTELPGIECETCLGNSISCNMCNVRRHK